MFQPRAADLDLTDVETALVRGAVGDYADEAAVAAAHQLSGHWLPQLQFADLITVVRDIDSDGLGRRSPGLTWNRPNPPAASTAAAASGGCSIAGVQAVSPVRTAWTPR